jgi:hypothetical protein
MPWLVVYMTVIFPLLLMVLLVMDLVEFETKVLESPPSRRQDRTDLP